MGLFDTVHVRCPECFTRNAFITKAGPCTMANYELDTAPQEILLGVARRDPVRCAKCGTLYKVVFTPPTTKVVYPDEVQAAAPAEEE